MPSLRFEKILWDQGLTRVVGVDEVGMATLAGPVVAAACLVMPDVRLIRAVRDSNTASCCTFPRHAGTDSGCGRTN